MGNLFAHAKKFGYARSMRKIDGNTWEFVCGGREAGEGAHAAVTYIGRKEASPCPVCQAIASEDKMRRHLENVQRKVRAFFDLGFTDVERAALADKGGPDD